MNLRSIENKIVAGDKLSQDEKEHLRRRMLDYWDNHPDVTNRFPRWKKYLAWTAGYQIYDYNKISKKLVEVPLDRRRNLIFNRLRSYVRVLYSKLASDVPHMGVIPNTTEYDDIEAARCGDRLVQGLAEKINFFNQLNDFKLWMIFCNRAFLRVFWNKEDCGTVGYRSVERFDEELGMPMEGDIEEIEEEGEIGIEAVSPFNCRVDPLYFDHDKWRWFVYGYEVDAEEMEDEYDLGRGTLQESSTAMDKAYDLELQDEQDMIVGGADKREEVTGKTVIMKELWTPRIYVFMAGDTIVDYDRNRYNEIPFYLSEDRLIPIENYERGYVYNESMLKDAIPVQKEYNRQISLLSLALDRAAKLRILTPAGSILQKKFFTNDFGMFMDYNPRAGVEPHQMKMDPIPSFLPTFKQEIEREMESVFHVHAASFGQLPERASHASGTLMNMLLEQDDVVLNPLIVNINHAVGRAWSLALRIVKDNYTVGRLIRYIGDDGGEMVEKFRGADLRGNTDIKVTSQTGLPRSRALKIEYLLKLRQQGLLTDDKNIMELLEFGNAEKVFEDTLLHERRANRENRLIETGEGLTPEIVTGWVYPLEDVTAHLKIHLRLRLGQKWDSLSPEQQQLLELHIQATYQRLQMMQQQMMQQQVAARSSAGAGSAQSAQATTGAGSSGGLS